MTGWVLRRRQLEPCVPDALSGIERVRSSCPEGHDVHYVSEGACRSRPAEPLDDCAGDIQGAGHP